MARILVVDDDAEVRAYLRKVLEGAGHTVAEAVGGSHALARYQSEPADLVLLDLLMPDKDGIETTRELVALDPDARIVTMTGALADFGPSLDVTLLLGARKTLQKPVRPKELLAAVDQVLGA